MLIRPRNVEKKKKKIVLSSSLRIPHPYLLLENPNPSLLGDSWASYQPA